MLEITTGYYFATGGGGNLGNIWPDDETYDPGSAGDFIARGSVVGGPHVYVGLGYVL